MMEPTERDRAAEIRRRIHELYQQPKSPIAHERELIRLHAELSQLLAERPEVRDGRQ